MTRTVRSEDPVIVWFRRDLRLHDNPALRAAADGDAPVIPLFILDETPTVRFPGAASLWWLNKSLQALEADLHALGSRLVLRRGQAADEIVTLCRELGVTQLYYNRLYDPGVTDRDAALEQSLKGIGVEVQSFNASLLIEPGEVKTKAGGVYQVFTPFWRAARQTIRPFRILQAPIALAAPKIWPESAALASWKLHPTAPDWSERFPFKPGEAGAQSSLKAFLDDRLEGYRTGRDQPAAEGTSRLSAPLHWGEIGPRQAFRAAEAAAHAHPALHADEDRFLTELGWREFNHHLLFQRPDLPDANFDSAFDAFPWRTDSAGYKAWTLGRTGYPMVDAGLRQLWATGFMENRVRMVVASFLIKHLLLDWRDGERWFWDTLVDASPANNVLNWQWVAGSGADASPFFRIFNPVAQGERFDARGDYVRRWVPELRKLPADVIHAPWTASAAVLKTAGVVLGTTYPQPIVNHETARARALDALRSMRRAA